MRSTRAVRYVRAAEQSTCGAESAARANVSLPELDVVQTVQDDADAGRPRLAAALDPIAAGDATVLLVPSLRTVAGSLRELVRVIDWLADAGATLVTEDAALDTGSAAGRAAAGLLREIASWDEAPDPGRPRRGRPSLSRHSPELVDRIVALRASGMSLQAIADQLNAEGMPTPRGGATWRPSSVQSALGYRRPRPPSPGLPPLPRPSTARPPHRPTTPPPHRPTASPPPGPPRRRPAPPPSGSSPPGSPPARFAASARFAAATTSPAPRAMNEAVALAALAVTLAAAVAQPRWAPDWLVAAGAALLLVVVGVLSFGGARAAVRGLGPTVAFLAALLWLGDGCRRAGMFEALGAGMASQARGRPDRLLALVFVAAGVTTAVLSLDATVVLLTPIVFATAARLMVSPRPHVYACSHLANSASLLLPISNLTNLLAFRSSGLSFMHFAALMAVPWLIALSLEWLILSRSFSGELRPSAALRVRELERPQLPVFALAVLGATLVGFALSSAIGVPPAWIAAAGALALTLRQRPPVIDVVRAVEPTFLVFVLALGVIVSAASAHGLSTAVDALLPHGDSLPDLLAIAVVSAVLSNVVNNLPATLIILPVAALSGPGPVLAMLVGVNVGPNLTYVGSLATLLWRRIVHAHDHQTDVGEFVRLGIRTVPIVILASTGALWLALHVV